ncbi:MAG: acylphosphatase [Candidatus Rifleibacteriota bacterium]
MSEQVLKRFKVRGRVQGVGFRSFVQKAGRTRLLRGWVKNNADGSVTVEVIGPVEKVCLFMEDVRKGSFFSRVDDIEILHQEMLGEEQDSSVADFEIRY